MRLAAMLVLTLLSSAACDSASPTSPSASPLPVIAESAHYVVHAGAGETVDTDWQEAYHQWAAERLGVKPDRKIGYYKYTSRQHMGQHTGQYNTNAYADPVRFEIHTLWPTDNHEVVHLFMSLVGQSTALFAEGMAVAFQTDPVKGVFESRFNGEEVHHAARRYLDAGQLVLPLDRIIETSGFRSIADSTLVYREAGSFVRFLIDRFGLQAVLAFFRAGGSPPDTAPAVKSRFRTAFGLSFEEAEAAWLELLRAGTGG